MAKLRADPAFQSRLDDNNRSEERRALSRLAMQQINKTPDLIQARAERGRAACLAFSQNAEIVARRNAAISATKTEQAARRAWPFQPLKSFGYSVIMADPPWHFTTYSEKGDGRAPQAHYETMPTSEIAALPVDQLAGGNCWLWLWGTFAMIRDALAVMEAWRFEYVTGGTWVKRGESGKLAFGTGFVLRGNAEVFLIGKIGKPQIHSRSIRNVLEAPRGRHSEKPDIAYDTAEILFGPAFRADLFSRRTRQGWDSWGKQAGILDAGGQPIRPVRPAPAISMPSVPDLFGAAA